MWTNGTCTTHHLFWRITRTDSSVILRYKRISKRYIVTTQNPYWRMRRISSLGFRDTNGSPYLNQTTRPYNNQQQKKRTCKILDFAVPADHRVKLKESEKKGKCLDLAWEMKKLWNMKVTIIPIVISALGAVTKALIKGLEIRGWVETLQTTALLRSARILRRVLETWGDLLSTKLQWKIIS